ncbi:MAG: MSCRAMM family protein, partial [Vicinamibacteria bacterium]
MFGAGAELSIPLDVSGVETIRLDFQGTTIRVGEVRIRGIASGDIGYALQDLVFSESASIDVSVRNADSDLVSSFVQPQIGSFNLSEIGAPSGKVFLAPIPPEAPVVLNARGNVGHRFQRASVAAPPLSAGAVTPVEILLPLGARVSGQATNNSGVGIPSHTVNLFPVTGPGARELGASTSTNATGFFAFEQVPSGTYRLRSTFGSLTLDIPFTVEAPTPVVQNLAFLSPGNVDLQIRFESADGSQIVVNGSRVELVDSQNQVWVRTTVNGLASIANVPAGPFLLRITHPTNGASITELNQTLSPGQTLQLSLAIPAFGTVEGDVF